MNDREVIAIMTDTLKSVREAIVYTFPPSELNTELYKRVNLALAIGMDKLNEANQNEPKPVPKQTRSRKTNTRSNTVRTPW